MAKEAETLILKVLSGARFGAEVALEPGEYGFGSGDEAELSFPDSMMADQHGTLRVAEGRIELRADNGPLRTGSGLELAAGDAAFHEIAQLDVVTAGTTRFAVGARRAAWGKLETGSAAPPPPPRRRWRAGPPIAVLGLAAVLLAGTSLLDAQSAGSRIAGLVTGPEPTDAERVREALVPLPYASRLEVTAAEDGRVAVQGYVDNVAQRRAVREALGTTGVPVQPNIWVVEVVGNDVRGLLRARNSALEAEVGPDGVVTLRGEELSDAALGEVMDLIRSDVLGVADVREEVRSAGDILREVTAMLEAARLDATVILRLDGAVLEATGVVPADKVDNWVGFVTGYAADYAATLPLRSFVSLEGRAAADPMLIGGDGVADAAVVESAVVEALQGDGIGVVAEVPEAAAPAEAAPDASDEDARLRDEAAALLEAIARAFAEDPARVLAALGLAMSDAARAQVAAMIEAARADPPGALAQLPPETQAALRELVAAREELAEPVPVELPAGTSGGVLDLLMGNDVPALTELAVTLRGDAGVAGSTASGDPTIETAVAEALAAGGAADPATGQAGDDLAALDPAGTAPAPLPAVSFDPAFGRLMDATDLVLEADGDPALVPGLPDPTSVSALAPGLVEILRAQHAALREGRTLLGAVPGPNGGGARCWPGASFQLAEVPTILFWLDYFSLENSADLAGLKGPNQLVFYEAALSPERVRACLVAEGSPAALRLLDDSLFLAETAVNADFGDYLFRNVPEVALDVAGLSLVDPRYIELRDGRRLQAGSAPDLQSRVAAIGDLGVVLRVPGGYAARLYDDDVGWVRGG